MKRFFVLLTILVAATMTNAQNETQAKAGEMQTIFGKNAQPSLGWMIGTESGYTQFDGHNAWLCGLTAGMVIDRHLTIGVKGTSWHNRNSMLFTGVTDTASAYLEGGYGGLLLEYTLFPNSPVHLTFPVLIGGGALTYVSDKEYFEWDDDEWDSEHLILDDDVFFVIEPGIRAEVNILRFMKLGAGISYRYSGDVDLVNTPDDLLNNFTATVGLKFGKF